MTIATTTALWYIMQDIIWKSPLKMGVPGEISKDAMKDLAGAFEIFAKIKQANGDTYEVSRKKHG